MRATKQAIAEALRTDRALSVLVPDAQVFAVERATIPTLPSVEVIGISSERVDSGPMVRHELSIECTCSHATEDAADLALDAIVRAVRARLSGAEDSTRPIAFAGGAGVTVELQGSRWQGFTGWTRRHRQSWQWRTMPTPWALCLSGHEKS